VTFRKALLAASAVVLSNTAQATTVVPQKFVCPVGGEKFIANVIASMTSWGQRPDGRRYGTTPIVPLTECPGNGFVYFDEKFSESDAQKLEPLVNGPDYQALRKSDRQHFRAWWLMDRLGRDPLDTAWMLLVASWESDDDPTLKSRYQRAYVDVLAHISLTADKRRDWFWMNLRAADALRELGEFDKSNALLATLDRSDLLPTDKEELEGARYLIDGLKSLNADRNAKSEPTNLIPPRIAAEICASDPKLSPVEVKACGGPEIVKILRDRSIQ
jgi:hypothetical protein